MTANANLPTMTPQQTKDLLIHAAKAAGLEGYTFQEETPLQSAMMVRRNIDEHGWDIGVQEFDPINCDGDAFGLMVTVKLRVDHEKHSVYVGTSGDDGEDICAQPVCVSISRARATRLAITKAAAMTEGWRE